MGMKDMHSELVTVRLSGKQKQRLARTVSPTTYTPDELAQRIAPGDAFVKRVLAQPKLWIIGGEAALGLSKGTYIFN